MSARCGREAGIQGGLTVEVWEEKLILCCEDSLDGIFSGVYEGWAGRYGHPRVELLLEEVHNMELFARYIQVPTDPERAGKVARTIRSRMGQKVFEEIGRAALSFEADRGTAVYQLIAHALSMEQPGRVLEVLTDPWVIRVMYLARNVWNEAHHLLGFVRFEELQNRVLLSVIRPKNRVLPILALHFADRLPKENWMIYDRGRQEFAVHPAGRPWVLVRGETLDEDMRNQMSDQEREFRELWKGFLRNIMIEERKNEELQVQMLPKRFQKYMTEFS